MPDCRGPPWQRRHRGRLPDPLVPGNKFDWIGIYSATDPDLYNYYLYTNASVAGAVTFKTEDFGDALAPGEYEARLVRDDACVELAIAKFTVTE